MAATEHSLNDGQSYALTAVSKRFVLSDQDRRFLFITLGSLLLVRLAAMFTLPFADTTEARYAEIARIMLETGDWITPQFDYGVPFWGKPPLHTWLSAAGMAVFGVGEFGARVFILAAGLGVLALTFHWVKRWSGWDQALLVCVVLFSSVMFFGAAAFVMTDMVLVLGLTLSMVGFHICIASSSSQPVWGKLFFVGLAIGLLAKGPVAIILTGIPVVPWLVLTGYWRTLGRIPWLAGFAILPLLAFPWYIAAEIKTPGFIEYFLVGEHFERFVVSGWDGDLYGSGHARPLGIIWLYWIGAFLPWTLLVLPLIFALRLKLGETSEQDKHWHLYLLLWALSPLFLFSTAANLLSAYVLPSLPATAILLVSLWARSIGGPTRLSRIAFVCATGCVAIVFAVVSVLTVVAPQTLSLRTERELVRHAQNIQPDIRFTYWGNRSFSADFYTTRLATYTIRTSALDALLENKERDAVAVGRDDAQALAPFLENGFENVGTFGRRVLFIEKTRTEPSS